MSDNSLQDLQSLIARLPVGVYRTTPDGKIAAANPALAHLLGYDDVADLEHVDVGSLYVEQQQRQSMMDRVALGKAIPPEEFELRRRDGSTIWVRVTSNGVRSRDGEVLFYEGVMEDVSDRRLAERALVAAKETAEAASRAKDEFLAAMSHELRTPLNAVIGLSTVLQEETFGPLNAKQREYAGRIEASGRHLLGLINDILDLAKIQASGITPDFDRVDVAEVIARAVQFVSEAAAAHALVMETSLAPGVGFIRADSRRVKQILLNLLANAIKFTPPGGRIGVDARVAGDWLVITVWDTGPGIPLEQQSLLFKPFQQIDSTLDRNHEGTGLGLALTAELVGLHGGTIQCDSAPGRGARFTFRLPVAGPDPAAEPEPPALAVEDLTEPAAVAPGEAHVLVVEDNEINRIIVSDYLIAHGFEVSLAEDGIAGLEAARTLLPDVILMDVQLPGMDGLAVTRELKSDEATRRIPVAALTALAMKGDAERCLAAGCDAYLGKPCDPDDVLRLVHELLELVPEA